MATPVRTMCPMNCHPTLCGMLVDVHEGRLPRVRGDPENPDSRGFLCIRGRAAHEIPDNPSADPPDGARGRRGEVAACDVGRGARHDRGRSRRRPRGVAMWTGMGPRQTTTAHGRSATWSAGSPTSTPRNLEPDDDLLGSRRLWARLTGVIDANTKEDIAAHAQLMMLWGANLASQPTTGRT